MTVSYVDYHLKEAYLRIRSVEDLSTNRQQIPLNRQLGNKFKGALLNGPIPLLVLVGRFVDKSR